MEPKHRQFREVRVIDLLLYAGCPPIALAVVWVVFGLCVAYLDLSPAIVSLLVAVALIPTYYCLKYFAIGLVLAYKSFAPLSTRNRCRFTPTCSTYMLMAIGKYGLFVGVYKGIRRILRCRPPNGGEDYP